MQHEYMIRERAGEFIIMCRHEYVSGILWWKSKKISDWKRCDASGYPVIYAPQIYIITYPLPPFSSLEAAKAHVELFKKGTIDHLIDK